jgi:sterol desaturase/sphingolipid hydroxylase (fatty acid hydroxylase superfamily)
MFESLPAMLGPVFKGLYESALAICVLAVLFSALGMLRGQACNATGPWWRKEGLKLDLVYWFTQPLFGPLVKLLTISLVVGALSLFVSPQTLERMVVEGHGPLSGLPFWAQIVVYMLAYDFMSYWAHRILHGRTLWRIHAIHHAPRELDWISCRRFHPLNTTLSSALPDVVLLSLGIAPVVIIALLPFNYFMNGFVHANLRWTLGPFRYVIASPVFHRWHHGPVDQGGEKNFAPTFPFIDLMFGTFYMPEGKLPADYGVDDPHFPETFVGQMAYPFIRPEPAKAPDAAAPSG